MCSEITVKIRYSDFQTHTKQRKIAFTCSDQMLIQHAGELLKLLFVRRSRVRLIGIRLSGWVSAPPLLSLFDNPAPQQQLYQAMDKLRNRFGQGAVLRATSLDLKKQKSQEQ